MLPYIVVLQCASASGAVVLQAVQHRWKESLDLPLAPTVGAYNEVLGTAILLLLSTATGVHPQFLLCTPPAGSEGSMEL